MTTNNPIGGRQQSSDSSLPNLKATDESIIRLGSPQKEEVILPIEQVLEGRHEYKHGSLMGRMCQKPFTKKNSASPNMVAPSRDDFNLESARIDRHLSSSTNKINTKVSIKKLRLGNLTLQNEPTSQYIFASDFVMVFLK